MEQISALLCSEQWNATSQVTYTPSGASEQGVQGGAMAPPRAQPLIKGHLRTSDEPQTAPAKLCLLEDGKLAKDQMMFSRNPGGTAH